jgi:hypothetical protein
MEDQWLGWGWIGGLAVDGMCFLRGFLEITLKIPRINQHRCGEAMISLGKESTNSGFCTSMIVYRCLQKGRDSKIGR